MPTKDSDVAMMGSLSEAFEHLATREMAVKCTQQGMPISSVHQRHTLGGSTFGDAIKHWAAEANSGKGVGETLASACFGHVCNWMQ